MTKLGVVFRPQLPPERLRGVAEAADEAGLEELWLWEDCFLEGGIATAAAALAWTERLTVGIGVLPVPLRNVALTAMEVATLDRMFPGRFRVGVGHGVLDWMAQVGERVASPMTLLTEYTAALRRLLAGEQVSVEGRYVRLDRVALDWPPAEPVPVLLAAIGPRTLQLAGEVADGTVLTGGTTPEQVREAAARAAAGRTAAGRTDRHAMVVYVPVETGPEGVALSSAPDREQEVEATGGAAALATAVDRWVAAGADTLVLFPTDDADLEGLVRFVAEEVRPHLSTGAARPPTR